jgi:hypothetical protein
VDEYTADPAETEREAQKNLRKIESNKAKFEIGEMAEQSRADKAKANEYTKNYTGNTRAGGSGSGGDFGLGIQKMNRDLKRTYKSGGTVSSVSKRADGCCVKGKTKGMIV